MNLMSRKRYIELLTTTSVATYLLIIIGSVVSIKDVASECTTWPTCTAGLFPPLDQLDLVLAWSHRAAALLIGLLLATTVIAVFIIGERRKTKLALSTAFTLFLAQIAIGGVIAQDIYQWLPAIHLLFAISIFTLVLLALTWALETDLPGSDKFFTGSPPEKENNYSEREVTESLPRAYFRLMKPKLMWLLCLVAVGGMALAVASGHSISAWTAVATLFAGCLAVGASGTFNNILERDVDREMQRTNDRPVANREIPPKNAAMFGAALTFLSAAVFLIFVNIQAMILGLIAILFYSVVYTIILKPNTSQNIVIGGLVGGVPALIGWVAAANYIGLPSIVLGGIVFLWTPAHFYNLAIIYRDDYSRSGFPMLPVVEGDRKTLRHMMYYLCATMIAAGLMGVFTPLGWIYSVLSITMGALFIYSMVELYRERTRKTAFRTFIVSNMYLGVVVVAIVLDVIFA